LEGYAEQAEAQRARVTQNCIRNEAEAPEAPLVVHAEGAAREAKEKSYQQEATVALVTTQPAATHTAWERFTPEGPLALLPLAGRYCVVWGLKPERAHQLCVATQAEFLSALQQAFGGRAGAFIAVAERSHAPLGLRVRASR